MPRIMKLHRYIDHDSQMTPIDFQVTRIMKLHRFNDHDSQMTPIDIQVTRLKVNVTKFLQANSADPDDETPHHAAAGLKARAGSLLEVPNTLTETKALIVIYYVHVQE
ncbi:hypothetical protein DPMN_053329 [Dreissena polymorpha]|uniref:Uncharacterized protein n=1 Tax=Dreissena polymorpha TaxID=45954 RepID=A0A9D4CL59_DREPO|nr:hypothetical protein DPMN_053329 [Dreissena polymorpha]